MLAVEIIRRAGNWPQWFFDQISILPQWRHGWPEGAVIVPPDAEPVWVTSTFWVPPRVSIIGDRRRGRRDYKQAFLTALGGWGHDSSTWILRVMKSPEKDGSEKKSGNANFNQELENLLFMCNDRAQGPLFYGAQESYLTRIRVKNPLNYGCYIGYGSRNVEISGLDIDADFKKGMRMRSEATGLMINGAGAQVRGNVNCYGVWHGVGVTKSKGVSLNVCTENVETAAVVDGKVTVPARGYGGKGVQTFQVRA